MSILETVDFGRLLQSMSPEELDELDRLMSAEIVEGGEIHRGPIWEPLPGAQTDAYVSLADILYYGGEVGGGKTDLVIGLSLTSHLRSIIFRRQLDDLAGIEQRIEEILQTREGFSEGKRRWRIPLPGPRRLVEFGGANRIGDEQSYMGRPHDLKAFDEVAHFVESQFRFLITWARSSVPGQRSRVVAAGNPPLTVEGQWVNRFWAPWLDPKHPDPARPGELRWFARIDDEDVEVETSDHFVHDGEEIIPKSRTFIPAGLDDNPYYGSDYKATVQALPEPWRSMLLRGDYSASVEDDPWQVIPTAWVLEAQARWKKRRRPDGPMESLGVDVARGGRDKTALAPRYGNYFDALVTAEGELTPRGEDVARIVLPLLGEHTHVNVDVIGVGSSAFDAISAKHRNTHALNSSGATRERDKLGIFGFRNLRALWHWRLREALDPQNGDDVALPDDPELLADLTAARWRPTLHGVQVEDKEQIKARIGRSPDKGEAVIYARAMEHIVPLVTPAIEAGASYWRV